MDLLSLDTEGSELCILESLNFDTYSFSIIDVEHNHVEPRRKKMHDLLISKGYIYDGPNNFDDRYIYSFKNVLQNSPTTVDQVSQPLENLQLQEQRKSSNRKQGFTIAKQGFTIAKKNFAIAN